MGEDSDGDGFFIDKDCNDSNPDVNPNATEVPYNGIDDDCVDGDLIDVDGDSFVSDIVGGNDCNDSDVEYNINSEDPYKNQVCPL